MIKTTTNSKEIADNISNRILNEKLSPCIHIYKNIYSSYRWKNNINVDREYVLEIKTKNNLKKQIVDIINNIHNYDVPEIISTDINILNNKYKKWFNENI